MTKKHYLIPFFSTLLILWGAVLISTPVLADDDEPECSCSQDCDTDCSYGGPCNRTGWEPWSGVSCRDGIGSQDGSCTDTWTCDCCATCPSGGSWNSSQYCDPGVQQCDYTNPTCTTAITPSNWTNNDVTASVGSCSDDLSGCRYYSTATLTDHNTRTQVDATDWAGNTGTCSYSPYTKIDRIAPVKTGNTTLTSVGHPGGDLTQDLSDSTSISFAANEQFKIDTGITDSAAAGSGRSGFSNNCRSGSDVAPYNSWIRIQGPDGNIEGEICRLSSFALNDEGSATISINNNVFSKAGEYMIAFQIYDQAGNTAGEISGLLLNIIPTNVSDTESSNLTFIGYQKNGETYRSSATCEHNLIADRTDACGLKLELKDRFRNPIGDGGLPLVPTPPDCTFGFSPAGVDFPVANPPTITLNWTCTNTNSVTYSPVDIDINKDGVTDDTIDFGLISPPEGGSGSYTFLSNNFTEPQTIHFHFTAHGDVETKDFTVPFIVRCVATNNTEFPICFDAEFTLP